jgi:hypothetical protein
LGKLHFGAPWYGNTILLLFLYTAVHWVYIRRASGWGNVFVPDIFPNGGSRIAASADEHFRRKRREDWGLPDPTGKSDEEFLSEIQSIETKILKLAESLE